MSLVVVGKDFPAEVILMMRDWLADCYWSDMDPEDFDDSELVPDRMVVRAVAREFDQGLAGFVAVYELDVILVG